jgi:nitrite reductase/ring-hydroxylating ferredoxin subunit
MSPDDTDDTPAWVPVGKADALADGDIIPVEVAGRALIVFRDGDRIGCLQRKCLHQGGDLANGVILREHLICPVHGWKFSTRTGVHAESPETCLARHDVRVVDGILEVDPTPRRG